MAQKLFQPEPVTSGEFSPEPVSVAKPKFDPKNPDFVRQQRNYPSSQEQGRGGYGFESDTPRYVVPPPADTGALAGAKRGVKNTASAFDPRTYADMIVRENAPVTSEEFDNNKKAFEQWGKDFEEHPIREGVTSALNTVPVVGPWLGGLFNRSAKGDLLGAVTEAATTVGSGMLAGKVLSKASEIGKPVDLTPTRKQIQNLEGVVGGGAPKNLTVKEGVPQTREALAGRWQPMAKTQFQKLGVSPEDVQTGGIFGKEKAPQTDIEGNLGRGLTVEKSAEVSSKLGRPALPLPLEVAEGAVTDADTAVHNALKPFHHIPVENLLAEQVDRPWDAERAGQPGGVVSTGEGVGPNNNIQTQLASDLATKAAEYTTSDPALSSAYEAAKAKVLEMGKNVKGLLDLKSHANKESSRYNQMGQTAVTNASATPGFAWKYLADNIRNKLYPSLEAMGAPSLREMGQNEATAIQARDGLFQEYQKTKTANAVEARQGWLGRLVRELPMESRGLVSAPARATMLGRLIRGNPLPMAEFNKMFVRGVGPTEGFVPPEIPTTSQPRLPENAGPDIYGFSPAGAVPQTPFTPPSPEGYQWNAATGAGSDVLRQFSSPSGVAPTGGLAGAREVSPTTPMSQFDNPSGAAPVAGGLAGVQESKPPVDQFASPSGVAPKGIESVRSEAGAPDYMKNPSGSAPVGGLSPITPQPVGAPDQFASPSGVAPTQGIRPIAVPPPTLAGTQQNMPGALLRPENAVQAESFYPGKTGLVPEMTPEGEVTRDYTRQPHLFGTGQQGRPSASLVQTMPMQDLLDMQKEITASVTQEAGLSPAEAQGAAADLKLIADEVARRNSRLAGGSK